MIGTKLHEVYNSMPSAYLRRLDKFIESTYFNESDVLVGLHTYIRNYIHNDSQMEKRIIFSAVFKEKRYNDTKMRYFMSRLYALIEQFIYIESIQNKDSREKNSILYNYFSKFNCNKAYQSILNHIAELEIKPTAAYESNSIDTRYLDNFYLNGLLLQDSAKSIVNFKKKGAKQLFQMLNDLDNFYFINKLSYLCSIINNKNVIQFDYDITLKDEIMKLLKDESFNSIPVVKVYILILQMLEDTENTEHYYRLKKYITSQSHHFDIDTLKNIFSYAQNYCIRKMNAGKSDFSVELFDIYQYALKYKILVQDGELSEINYRNIVVTGLRIGKTNWTKDFIENYKSKLSESNRENAYIFNMSSYYFYLKKYDKVLELLRDVVFTDVYYSNDYRIILLKTYYELDEREAAFALISSFRAYLRRKKQVSDSHRIANSNFLRFYKKIYSAYRNNTQQLEQLKNNLNSYKSVTNKDWLLQKIDELLNRTRK